jgi:hypothetical protein
MTPDIWPIFPLALICLVTIAVRWAHYCPARPYRFAIWRFLTSEHCECTTDYEPWTKEHGYGTQRGQFTVSVCCWCKARRECVGGQSRERRPPDAVRA